MKTLLTQFQVQNKYFSTLLLPTLPSWRLTRISSLKKRDKVFSFKTFLPFQPINKHEKSDYNLCSFFSLKAQNVPFISFFFMWNVSGRKRGEERLMATWSKRIKKKSVQWNERTQQRRLCHPVFVIENTDEKCSNSQFSSPTLHVFCLAYREALGAL